MTLRLYGKYQSHGILVVDRQSAYCLFTSIGRRLPISLTSSLAKPWELQTLQTPCDSLLRGVSDRSLPIYSQRPSDSLASVSWLPSDSKRPSDMTPLDPKTQSLPNVSQTFCLVFRRS
ncbi:hypothetical protein DPMN_009631 [Dreissena polymorpha]|uniref:Uncharacterized protein n=1 Tax=Dreissena polymorpha TaxID=45954 RepID=A0A9D4MZZ5_DREPO|nr:hypothetical protein DPMN_009631 [Dreissena polymorpha]